jgi:hypothetical protein
MPLGALLGSIAALLTVLATAQALAQASARPTITIAATIAAEPASQAALPIRVGPPDALPRNSFVRVRGLPPAVALSDGYSIAPGAWAVPIGALPSLKMTLPSGAAGRSEIVIALVAIDGAVLAEAKSMLTIAARNSQRRDPGAPAAASILRAGTPSKGPPEPVESSGPALKDSPPPATPQDRERALRLMKKGDAQLEDGNVSGARLFYERAADAGLAQAAMALAATFDALELPRLKLRGVPPDRKQARRWYERAHQLGAGGAEERLRRIGGN